MGFLEDMFDPHFVLDSEYKQRRDIRDMQQQAEAERASTARRLRELQREIDRLHLTVNALASLLERKRIATREELEVTVQQLDLLDGIEDGRIARTTWAEAPRCEHCNHFVNPRRETCVYCGRSLALQGGSGGPYRGGGGKPPAPPPRMATCASCRATVPQSETYFTEEGELHCQACFGTAS